MLTSKDSYYKFICLRRIDSRSIFLFLSPRRTNLCCWYRFTFWIYFVEQPFRRPNCRSGMNWCHKPNMLRKHVSNSNFIQLSRKRSLPLAGSRISNFKMQIVFNSLDVHWTTRFMNMLNSLNSQMWFARIKKGWFQRYQTFLDFGLLCLRICPDGEQLTTRGKSISAAAMTLIRAVNRKKLTRQ